MASHNRSKQTLSPSLMVCILPLSPLAAILSSLLASCHRWLHLTPLYFIHLVAGLLSGLPSVRRFGHAVVKPTWPQSVSPLESICSTTSHKLACRRPGGNRPWYIHIHLTLRHIAPPTSQPGNLLISQRIQLSISTGSSATTWICLFFVTPTPHPLHYLVIL